MTTEEKANKIIEDVRGQMRVEDNKKSCIRHQNRIKSYLLVGGKGLGNTINVISP